MESCPKCSSRGTAGPRPARVELKLRHRVKDLMLKRLAQIAMGYWPRPEARCALCNAPYSTAKPFVEGPKEFLICRNCVATAFDRLQRQPDRHNNLDASRNVDTRQITNPYAPPATSTSHAQPCKLCGSAMTHREENNVICDVCIVHSMELIDGQIKKT